MGTCIYRSWVFANCAIRTRIEMGLERVPRELWAQLSRHQRKKKLRKLRSWDQNANSHASAHTSIHTLAIEHSKNNTCVIQRLSTGTPAGVIQPAKRLAAGTLRSRRKTTAHTVEAGSVQQAALPRQTPLVAPPLEQLALQVRHVHYSLF